MFYVVKFEEYMANRHYDIVIFECRNVFFINCFPANTVKLLDTHDILSDKITTFTAHGFPYKDAMNISFEEELEIFAV